MNSSEAVIAAIAETSVSAPNALLSDDERISIINGERQCRKNEAITARNKAMHTVVIDDITYYCKTHPDGQSAEPVDSMTDLLANSHKLAVRNRSPHALRYEAVALLMQKALYGDYYFVPDIQASFHENPRADVLLVAECEGETLNGILTKMIMQRLLNIADSHKVLPIRQLYEGQAQRSLINEILDLHSVDFNSALITLLDNTPEDDRSLSNFDLNGFLHDYLHDQSYCDIDQTIKRAVDSDIFDEEHLKTLIRLIILDVLKSGQLDWFDEAGKPRHFDLHRIVHMQFATLITMDGDFFGAAGSNILINPDGEITKIDSGQSQLADVDARRQGLEPCHPFISNHGLARYGSINSFFTLLQEPEDHVMGLILACLYSDDELAQHIRSSCECLHVYSSSDPSESRQALSSDEITTIIDSAKQQRAQALDTLYHKLHYAPHLLDMRLDVKRFHHANVADYLRAHAKGREVLNRLGNVTWLQKWRSPRVVRDHSNLVEAESFTDIIVFRQQIKHALDKLKDIDAALAKDDYRQNAFANVLRDIIPRLVKAIEQAEAETEPDEVNIDSLQHQRDNLKPVAELAKATHQMLNNLCAPNISIKQKECCVEQYERQVHALDLNPHTHSVIKDVIMSLKRKLRVLMVNTLGLRYCGQFATRATTCSRVAAKMVRTHYAQTVAVPSCTPIPT